VIGASALAVYAAGSIKDNPGAGPSAGGSANARKLFQLSGGLSAPLVLGAAGQPVDLKVTNPNPQTLLVSEMRVRITGVTDVTGVTLAPGCSTAQFSVEQSTATVSVPPRSTVTLTGSARPRALWVNDPSSNQDACVGARLSLSYTGKGTLR